MFSNWSLSCCFVRRWSLSRPWDIRTSCTGRAGRRAIPPRAWCCTDYAVTNCKSATFASLWLLGPRPPLLLAARARSGAGPHPISSATRPRRAKSRTEFLLDQVVTSDQTKCNNYRPISFYHEFSKTVRTFTLNGFNGFCWFQRQRLETGHQICICFFKL